MIRSILLGLVISVAFASGAAAEHKLIYGAGTISCGEWQQYRSTGTKSDSYQGEAWIDGYLSGSNAAGNEVDFLAAKTSSVAYYAWIDNYCGQHPLDHLEHAVMLLAKELRLRAKGP
jgi:hypothetical protein